ncbi:hypothetical protein QYE76_061004 [Lolium multiflorum]|uniref:Ribonuclease H n=1 Tax=Lolium multiflorum TaxID=4521 RepID=A0AAD8S056_LOLMU|nr:hypothetical protein QYE76_061004 [Lolium multiflorum]
MVFTGLSQDTPMEAGNPAQVKPTTVFSPNTLRKTIIGEPPKSTPANPRSTTSTDPSSTRRSTTISTTSTPSRSGGLMLSLQHTIHYLESTLLKEKDPNYPVFSVKVPEDPNFVHEYPADIFFIAFEDVFNLFHWKRLDYNLLQDGSSTRTKAVRYLESFMLMNKEKNTILLPVFPEHLRQKGEFVRPDTKKLGFKHVIDFPCIKQPAGSIKEAFYVLHHLKGFVEDAEMMSLPPSKRDPIKMSGEINDDDLREDFHRLQMTYYVVFEGRVPGVYEEWEECKKQVHKFSGNCYKGYPTRHEAVAKWRAHQANKSKMKTFLVLSLLLTIVAAVLYFILV